MQKKEIIQIAVIVVAFGGAGLVLYNGLFKNSTTTSVVEAPVSQSSEKILPYGSTLDLNSVLYKRNLQFGNQNIPQVQSNSDVGIEETQLMENLQIKK